MKKLFAFLVMTAFLGVMILGGAYVIAGSADPKIAVINKGVNNKNTVDFLNEDDLVSDSDGAVASQQSIKAYVAVYSHAKVTEVDLSGTSYYNITAPGVYFINDHESTVGTRVASGVSIMLPKITSSLNGFKVKVVKIPNPFSGSTMVVISTAAWSSGTTDHIWGQLLSGATTWSTEAATGVTNESATKVPPEIQAIDSAGDWLEYTAFYATTGSTWYQTGRFIQ